MSTGFSYFFNYDAPIESLVEKINDGVGGNFMLREKESDEQSIYDGVIAGIWVILHKHDLDWDVDAIMLSDYQYRLNFVVTSPNNALINIMREAIVMTIWALYFRLKITGAWVYESERVVANYAEKIHPERNRLSLYDTVSSSFIAFHKHHAPWSL